MKTSLNWTRENIAWLAGILEGEGCFSCDRGRPRIQVRMTDKDVLERCVFISGFGRIYGPINKPNRKPMWYWKVTNSEKSYALICAVYPFLMSRRAEKIRSVVSGYIDSGEYKSRMHGTRQKYKIGCRCDLCRAAGAVYALAKRVNKLHQSSPPPRAAVVG
jgi:hypothetical protein